MKTTSAKLRAALALCLLAGAGTLAGTFALNATGYPGALAVDSSGQRLCMTTETGVHTRSFLGADAPFALIAGGPVSGFEDGPALSANFGDLSGLAVDPATGGLYLTDWADNAIRKLTAGGTVATLWLTATTAPAVSGSGGGGNSNGGGGGGGGAPALPVLALLAALLALRARAK
ncbi:MAG: hypothetical protein LBC18_14030 [Opitutaceae bacterium]|nr:hypothetical protein [Opitutaceae bacterium]